jgi:hypothetical protein
MTQEFKIEAGNLGHAKKKVIHSFRIISLQTPLLLVGKYETKWTAGNF